MAAIIYVLFYLEVPILNIKRILGVHLDGAVELRFGILSLHATVEVQELLPHVVVVVVANQRGALQGNQVVEARLVGQVIWQLRRILGLSYQLLVHLYYLFVIVHVLLVDGQLDHVLDHARYQLLQILGRFRQRRIGIALD